MTPESLKRADMFLRGELDFKTLLATRNGNSLPEYTPQDPESHLDWVRATLHRLSVFQMKISEELTKLVEQEAELNICIKEAKEGKHREIFGQSYQLMMVVKEEQKNMKYFLAKIEQFEANIIEFGCEIQSVCC